MRIERDEQRLLAVLAALLLVFGLLAYLPARIERQRLQARIDAARADLEGGEGDAGELARLSRTVSELRDLTSRPQRHVPEEDELASVLRSLTEATSRPSVVVHEILIDEPRHYRAYSVIPVRVAFDGPFPAAFAVLGELESLSRMLRFDDLKVKVDEASSGVAVLLELSAFYSPEEGEGGVP